MPGIARKILICAAIDGLIIQPLSSKGQRPHQPVRVKYGEASVSPASRDQVPDTSSPGTSFEAFGIIGLITVSRLSYLITITRRHQVAQICGAPIYVVTEVAVTPCSSIAEAEDSIQKTALHLQGGRAGQSAGEDSDSSGDETQASSVLIDELEDHALSDSETRPDSARSSIAEDVIKRRGSYGRFAQRWFSGSGWTLEQKRSMGMSNSPTLAATAAKDAVSPPPIETPAVDEPSAPTQVSLLLPKLLRTAQLFFGSSRSFYFAYDFDITRNLDKRTAFPHSDVPLYAQVDSIFFWNQNILKPFLSAGQDSLALPLMQGFVGQRNFAVDSHPPQVDGTARDSVEMRSLPPAEAGPRPAAADKTDSSPGSWASEKRYSIALISRRSTKRAGLRYLRRGIDQDGFVANMVETEQLLSPCEWDPSSKVHSFLQIRGSIPLFFTQSPYSIKPVPVLQHSEETNRDACRTHFERLARNYGAIQIVNLVEKHGVEEKIGTRYEKTIEHLNSLARESSDKVNHDPLEFEWFDFHHACRGMKFENVSLLLSTLKNKLEEFGSTTAKEGTVLQKQKGILRTNCMDCLDRTNVCQSSFARHMLETQLKDEGFDMSAQTDQVTSWFNTLWADNGDAVSKQYASTAAMKGDYTRTRKRDYRGALNDFGLSLARFYSGMVNDYFSQTAIDFLLGNVTEKVFDEFEADMMTKDPAVSMSKMREQAIELCQKRVVADESEEFHGGWALLSPHSSDTIKSDPMEEVVLLLTDVALYLCRFDWNMEKVSSFERVHLSSITGIKLGTYITSTISASQANESKNVGFVVTYQPGKTDIKRTNTRTFSSRGDLAPKQDAEAQRPKARPLSFVSLFSGGSKIPDVTTKKLAFKAPYTDSSTAIAGPGPLQTELQLVTELCAEIERMTLNGRVVKNDEEEDKGIVEKGDIISLEEAKRNTGLLEQLGYSIKRLVWA